MPTIMPCRCMRTRACRITSRPCPCDLIEMPCLGVRFLAVLRRRRQENCDYSRLSQVRKGLTSVFNFVPIPQFEASHSCLFDRYLMASRWIMVVILAVRREAILPGPLCESCWPACVLSTSCLTCSCLARTER